MGSLVGVRRWSTTVHWKGPWWGQEAVEQSCSLEGSGGGAQLLTGKVPGGVRRWAELLAGGSLEGSGGEKRTQKKPSVPQGWSRVPVFPSQTTPPQLHSPPRVSSQTGTMGDSPEASADLVLSPQSPASIHPSTP